MNKYLDICEEVKDAINRKKAVVALESTIISHGMPYPQNVEMAKHCEAIIREHGAVPATIAITVSYTHLAANELAESELDEALKELTKDDFHDEN